MVNSCTVWKHLRGHKVLGVNTISWLVMGMVAIKWLNVGRLMELEDSQNPFNEPRGASDLKRSDDKVTVYWWGSYNTFVIPEIKGRKSAKIHVAFGAIGNKPLVTRMYLDGIYYRKDYVQVTKDIPNRFSVGSEVEVNFEDDKVWIDGKNNLGSVVDGSDLLTIPTDDSELELYFSSWANSAPEVTVEFEERWL